MIQNLNRISFRFFGSILPESAKLGCFTPVRALTVASDASELYQAQQPVELWAEAGNCVLSVSSDGESFQEFYLDKPVSVNAGIYFSLSAVFGQAKAVMRGAELPQAKSVSKGPKKFHITRSIPIDSLYTFFYQEKEPGFLFPGESHQMLELTYVDIGALHSVADGQDLLVKQGQMVLYGPGQWHMQYADAEVAPRFVTISFDAGDADLSCLQNRVLQPNQQAVSLVRQLLLEQERQDPYNGDMLISLLTQLLVALRREAGSSFNTNTSTHTLNNENEIVTRAQQYIAAHILDKLSVPAVAKNADVSPSYLTALFHKHLRISPGDYIRRIKLQESKRLIREEAMNFTQISQMLHYSSVHQFSRQFKSKFGITPSEYARSVK